MSKIEIGKKDDFIVYWHPDKQHYEIIYKGKFFRIVYAYREARNYL